MWKHFIELRKLLDEINVASKVKHSTDLVTSILRIQPRILVDVSKIDLSTTVLGYKISAPIMIAPPAMHKLAHHEGLNPLKMSV